MTEPNRNFVDDRHALYAGMVLGLAMKHGINLAPVIDDDGNYTPELQLGFEDPGEAPITVRLLIPEPPNYWTPESWLE